MFYHNLSRASDATRESYGKSLTEMTCSYQTKSKTACTQFCAQLKGDRHFSVTTEKRFQIIHVPSSKRGHAVAQLVEALRYKPEGREFDSRWCHWNFALYNPSSPGVDSASNRNEYQEYFLGVNAAGA